VNNRPNYTIILIWKKSALCNGVQRISQTGPKLGSENRKNKPCANKTFFITAITFSKTDKLMGFHMLKLGETFSILEKTNHYKKVLIAQGLYYFY